MARPKYRIPLIILATILALPAIASACIFHGTASVRKRAENQDLARLLERRVPAAPRAKVALTNVRVFDGEQFTGPQTVIIDGEYIAGVVPSGQSPGCGTEVIDGKGDYLLPGLIDNHCHPGSLDDLTNLTRYGATTAIGMACLSYDMCNALKDQAGLASFISSGLAAIGTGSQHAMLLGTPVEDTISSPDEAPQFVANVFGNHSAFLKIVAEEDGPSQDTINALVQSARNAGRVSTTHATTLAAYSQAIKSLTDSIQHTPQDAVITADMVRMILQQGQFVTPTLNVVQYIKNVPGAPANYTFEHAAESATALYNAGVPILVGTDSFVNADNPLPAVPFGSSLHAELEYLVQAGLEPLDVLKGATSLAAKLHSLPDRGEIKEGLRADLLLVSGNPLDNISNTRDIKRVWVGGLEYTGN
jgi:imidazolonepropionase-like amidohydrolase